MKTTHKTALIILVTAISVTAGAETDRSFRGVADASAAVALDDSRFIVADDEDNFLRMYDWNHPNSQPVWQMDLSLALSADKKHPEADIEAAAVFKNHIFWITSHGRGKKGQYRPGRCRLFATSITADGTLTVKGVYAGLLDDLIQYDRKWNLGLTAAIGTAGEKINPKKIEELAPKSNGLNIEGLCTTADGQKMLIGLRNPRPRVNGKEMALIIPLANPEALVMNSARAILEEPILVDLDGMGIRSMEYSKPLDTYLIVAGSHKGAGSASEFRLYAFDWKTRQPEKRAAFTHITPEALFQFPGQKEIILLSDDGSRLIDTENGPVENKQRPRDQRTFRTRAIEQ